MKLEAFGRSAFGKRVTKSSLLSYATAKKDIAEAREYIRWAEEVYGKDPYWYPVDVREKYAETKRNLPKFESLIPDINNFTDNVINRCKNYWSTLQDCGFDSELLKYLVV